MEITARIYWDAQDSSTIGWGWATRVNGEHDDTGPLGNGYAAGSENLESPEEMTDEELLAAFHAEVNADVPIENIEIVR